MADEMSDRVARGLLWWHLQEVRREMPDATWVERDREIRKRTERTR